MRKYPFSLPFLAVLFLLSACKTTYQPGAVNYLDYRVSSQQTNDTAMLTLLRPYADSLNKTMNDVIAVAGMTLEKKQPEGTLNNVLADAMMAMSKELYNTPVDAAFVNYGGVRLTTLPAGNITRGKIFEVAPFDNIVVLQKITGNIFQQFLDLVAARGGWPCAGLSFQIKDKKAINVRINNKPIEAEAVYTIALLDYVANGGDDCTMLKNIPQLNNGYLFRDAVTRYLSKIHAAGREVTANIENRVSNAK